MFKVSYKINAHYTKLRIRTYFEAPSLREMHWKSTRFLICSLRHKMWNHFLVNMTADYKMQFYGNEGHCHLDEFQF